MKRDLLACALCALLLGGCGGGGGGSGDEAAGGTPDGSAPTAGDGSGAALVTGDGTALPGTEAPVDDAETGDGTIAGRVIEAAGEAPLAGVEVELLRFDDGRAVAAATSDADGRFAFDALVRRDAYRLALSAEGYRDETVESVRLPASGALSLEPVRLVGDDNAGPGGLSGTILDATTGAPVAGLDLRFRRGIGARTGEVVASTSTDAAGGYAVAGLEHGNLTCEISGEGFQTLYVTVTVLGGIERTEQNAAVSTRPSGAETRIVLTWGASPADLDAHLTGPGPGGRPPFRVFYDAPEAEGASLDVDDTRSFGPETITAELDGDGPYRYSVHNFSGGASTALSRSGARVRVLRDGGPVAEFFAPLGEGDLWTVFDVVGGEIVPIDAIGALGSTADYFAPALRDALAPRTLARRDPPKR